MASGFIKRYLIFMALAIAGMNLYAQNNVPPGIHYQAVARDNSGNEIVNKKISVKFSVISGDPLSQAIYQELHNDVITSRFGVFSLVIGRGTPLLNLPCTNFSQIAWDQANHFLKVEVKFENDFMDMGTMQFLAVPYALYAQKSLEPGPEGPKGDKGEKGEPGDPASDNQTLSFDGSNLSISGTTSTVNLTPLLQTLQVSNDGTGGYNLALTRGNTINLATIEKDGDTQNEIQDLSYNSTTRELSLLKSNAPAVNLTELKNDADADPANEIQALTFNGAENKLYLTGSAPADLSSLKNDADADPGNEIQDLAYNSTTRELSLLKSTGAAVNLTELKNDADADPGNEIQDLKLEGNILKVTGKSDATPINMVPYLDNTDNQTLSFTESSNTLAVSGGNSVNLSALRDNTDSQTLNYIEETNELEISGGNKVPLGSLVAFRAKKQVSLPASSTTEVTFLPNIIDYNDGGGYKISTGEFIAPVVGIYTFSINYNADGSGGSRKLIIYLNADPYEEIATDISQYTLISRSLTMKLLEGDVVKLVIYTGTATQTGTGTFSGFKVY